MANLEAYGTNIVGSGSGGGGGLTQEEHDWLESLAAYEPNMYDINPNLVTDTNLPEGLAITAYTIKSSTGASYNKLPVCGYKSVKVNALTAYSYFKYQFQLSDGSLTQEVNFPNGWSDWISIPDNAVALYFNGYGSSFTVTPICVSLSATAS